MPVTWCAHSSNRHTVPVILLAVQVPLAKCLSVSDFVHSTASHSRHLQVYFDKLVAYC